MPDLARYILLPALIGGLVGLAAVLLLSGEPRGNGYADAVNRAAPAVVNIYTSQQMVPALCRIPHPRYQAWCDRLVAEGRTRSQNSLGSGVVVSEDGYILTNNHVIEDADEILVAFNNGQATTADVVGFDRETDLAVIKVSATGLVPMELGSSDDARIGDIVLAIGNPLGIGQTVSAGIISAKGRADISPLPFDDFIQTDAAINPGSSGGALVDTQGRLLGINTLIVSRSTGSEGIGFAIPSQLAMEIMRELVTHGQVLRGWLGVSLQGPLPGPASSELLVDRVYPNSPAATAGLTRGDRIVAIDNRPIETMASAVQQIAEIGPGKTMPLSVRRGEHTVDVTVQTGLRPPSRR